MLLFICKVSHKLLPEVPVATRHDRVTKQNSSKFISVISPIAAVMGNHRNHKCVIQIWTQFTLRAFVFSRSKWSSNNLNESDRQLLLQGEFYWETFGVKLPIFVNVMNWNHFLSKKNVKYWYKNLANLN